MTQNMTTCAVGWTKEKTKSFFKRKKTTPHAVKLHLSVKKKPGELFLRYYDEEIEYKKEEPEKTRGK